MFQKNSIFSMPALLLAFLFLVLPSQPAWAAEGMTTGEIMRYLGILASIITAVGLLVVEFVFRKKIRRTTYHWLLLVGLFAFPALALTGSSVTMLEETKEVNSCASCHVMKPFVHDLRDPASSTLAAKHFRNKWIPKNQCYQCHTTYGAHGTFASKRDGFRHWLIEVTGTVKKPIQYSGSYPNSNCFECHGGTKKFETIKSHRAMKEKLKSDRVSCITCHGPAHPLPGEREIKEGGKNE